MKRLMFVTLVVGGCLLASAPQSAQAFSSYWTSFEAYYTPCPDLVTLRCDTCHLNGTFALNPYGNDVLSQLNGGATITEAFVNLEPADSDGDLRDNQQEIQYDCTAPGDASDFGPVPGDEASWSQIQALFK